MNEMAQTALAWRAAGVTPLPLLPRTKIAAVKWRRWQKRIPPASLVKRWFSVPRNLGLVCGGPSGLIALDFDQLGAFCRWANQHNDLALSYSVATKRCRHVYFYTDTTAQTMEMKGCDVKLSGYILAPPSIHPEGKPYQAVNDHANILRVDLQEVLTGLEPVVVDSQRMCEGAAMPTGDEALSATPPQYVASSHVDLYYGVLADIVEALPILTLANRYTTMLISDHGAGRWWLGRCPNSAHEDVHPSFRVDAVHNQARCLTSTCKLSERRGMDVIELYRRLHGLRTRDAMVQLALELRLVRDQFDPEP